VIDHFAAHLLRRHVACRAQHHAFIRQIGGGRILRRAPLLGQPEIQNLHVAVARDHDVVRLQIAMHQTGRVRRRQPVGHLRGDIDRLRRGHRAGLDHAPQSVAADQFGSDPVCAVIAADVVNGDDVGVIERAGRAGFALETGDAVRVARQGGGQYLDGHLALQPRIAGAPDLAHPAPAQQLHNLEVAQLGARAEPFDRRNRSAFQERVGLRVQQRLHFCAKLCIVGTGPLQECGTRSPAAAPRQPGKAPRSASSAQPAFFPFRLRTRALMAIPNRGRRSPRRRCRALSSENHSR
jgi:hypothetical protein